MGQGIATSRLRQVVNRGDITCLHVDDRAFVWFCTPDGLFRFDGRNQVEYVHQHGLRAFARTYDGRLWVGGSAGLFELWKDAPTGTNALIRIPAPANLAINALLSLPSGALAVATDTGVMQITARTLSPLIMNGATLQGINEPVRAIFNITPHRFAAGTSNGVYLLLGDGRTIHLTTADGLPDNDVEAFAQGVGADRRLWIVTKRGLAAVDWNGIERGTSPAIATPQRGDPRSGLDVHAVQSAGGSLLFGTGAGIYVRDSLGLERPQDHFIPTSGAVRAFAGGSSRHLPLSPPSPCGVFGGSGHGTA